MKSISPKNVALEFLFLRNFNRRFTVRRLEQFGNPISAPLAELELPRGSILHYVGGDATDVGPSQALPFLDKTEKGALINHHLEYAEGTVGRPRKVTTGINAALMQYHRTNKRIRRARDMQIIERDPRMLFIENYAPLVSGYKYTTTLMSWYERWYNTYHTVFETLAKDAGKLDRQNYLFVQVPEVIPSITELRRAEKRRDNVTLQDMRNDQVLMFLELWTWLGANREHSIFNRIDKSYYHRINIIVQYRDRFINLNLGELNFWRKDEDGKGRVDVIQMQKRLYKSYVDIATRGSIEPVEPVNELADDASQAERDAHEQDVASRQKRLDLVMGNDADEGENDSVLDIDQEINDFDAITIDEDEPVEIIKREDKESVRPVDVNEAIDYKDGIIRACDKFIDARIMTSKEYNYIVDSAEQYKNIPNPFGEGMLTDMLSVDPEDLKVKAVKMIEDDPTLEIDPSMTESTIVNFNKSYINNVMAKDIAMSVMAMQKAGVIIKDYAADAIVDASGKTVVHTVRLQPVGGESSTVRFTMPLVDERGYWITNDVKFNMRKQRVDIPIRKTGVNTVALTTAYGKNFIQRTKKAVGNYPDWLCDSISAIGLDHGNLGVTDIQLSNVFVSNVKLPKDYTTISRRIASFTAGNVVYSFDYNNRVAFFGKDIDSKVGDGKLVPIGKSVDGLYVMDMASTIYIKTKSGMEQMGSITEVLSLDTEKAPKEYSELSMMGKAISLAIIFGFYLGLEGMLKLFKVPYRITEPNERIPKGSADFIIQAMNAKVVINYDSFEQQLIVQGLKPYLLIMKTLTLNDLNNKDAYLNLISKDGLGIRYLNELQLMDEMYVDPISERMLKQMNEPITFKGLLVRANEMLAYDNHKEEIDFDEMHIFGYQRHAMAVYTEMVRGVREYRNKPGLRKKLEIPNRAVWDSIAEDPSVLIATDANPIQSIREDDVVTFGGTGGRSRRSMVKRTRKYTDSDLGITSGDTVDSGDVGSTSYLTACPALSTLDGIGAAREVTELTATQLMGSAVALAPGSLYDDDKRINFVGIQHGSGTHAKGYSVTGFRTGYEKLVAHRTSDSHATIAEDGGNVVAIDANGITIEFDTKPVMSKTYPLGRKFGRHEGGNFPHDLVTKHKVGDTIKARDVITYNEHFFEPDDINPNQVNWKAGVMATTAFIEGVDVWEDSSVIDEWLADQLHTEVTKVKNISVAFDKSVHGLVKLGQKLDTRSILCTIEDALTATVGGFSSDSLSTLSNLSAQTPRAKVVGKVDKIEIFYNGEYEDMSESILEIAKYGDRQRSREAKSSPVQIADSCKVDSTLRIEGRSVELDTMVIRVYITHEVGTIGGDKGVFANQLKTTFRRVMNGRNETETGVPVNALFGRVAVDNRIVISVYQICTANKICMLASEHCMKILNDEI